jgi:hypothetical protein
MIGDDWADRMAKRLHPCDCAQVFGIPATENHFPQCDAVARRGVERLNIKTHIAGCIAQATDENITTWHVEIAQAIAREREAYANLRKAGEWAQGAIFMYLYDKMEKDVLKEAMRRIENALKQPLVTPRKKGNNEPDPRDAAILGGDPSL